MEEQSTPQWGSVLCALWWLTVEIVRTGKGGKKKGALQRKKKKKVLFSISYYIDVG